MRIPLSVQIRARSVARRTGITRVYWATKSRFRGEQPYEQAFDTALRGAIEIGDVVWDIGANVGRYTVEFSDLVGPQGHVVAFEPAPATFRYLSEAVDGRLNVTILNIALGEKPATQQMNVMDDARAGTHSLVTTAVGASAINVVVEPGDQARSERNLPTPNVLKIDVEGFEYEALAGLSETLRSCRAVLCEVHFGVLESRGLKDHPRQIEQLLRSHGFATRWVDASHLAATR